MPKRYKNPVFKSCSGLIRKNRTFNNKRAEQRSIAHEAKNQENRLILEQKAYHLVMSKAIADEILSRDLGLVDKELKFLTIPIRNKGDSKEAKRRLLDDLVRISFHQFYPPVLHRAISLSRVYRAIGIETELSVFFKDLNKKFEGILKIYARKFTHKDKIEVSVEFV